MTLSFEYQLITDVASDQPHTLTAGEHQAYATEVSFIAAVTDSAEYRIP